MERRNIEEVEREMLENTKEQMKIMKELFPYRRMASEELLDETLMIDKTIKTFENLIIKHESMWNVALKNRFVVYFPEELNIPEWCIDNVTLPVIGRAEYAKNKCCDILYTNLIVNFRNMIIDGKSFDIELFKNFKKGKFDDIEIKIDLLDPTGVPTSHYILKTKRGENFYIDELSYKNDNIMLINIEFSVSDLNIE